MFTSSAIRKLSRSEEIFAETQSYVGLGADVRGPVDVDALSAAFDTLLQAHPLLGGHLEQDPDGRHQFAVDDLLHPGIEVLEDTGPGAEAPPVHLDQNASLVHLRLAGRPDGMQLTLYVHHALADGHHEFGLVEEMFSYYTDLICTGSVGQVAVQPAPDPLETVLARRGIEKQQRSGLERFMPAVFAYDLPPSRRTASDVTPAAPVRVPMAGCRLSERETQDLIAFSRSRRVGLNGLLSAAVLMAEWKLRGENNIPVPYLYPVDLRYVLSPPLSATACTNPLGVATYLAEIDRNTEVVSLARDIAETFRADLAAGVIQQSLLHFTPQYVGNPPGMPDVVMLTDSGLVPPVRTPPDVELVAAHSEFYFAVSAGIDMYLSKIFAGQLVVEYHTHAKEPEKFVEAIHAVLRSLADQHAASGVS
ncbi:phthiocerol/phthiodiolone dimycocerosyl transferase family protein [Mycobacterium helveticum]|uniref:Phthiocerol/phthiodiolone dimycocerosyl transferase n=1 Tax=Mycobacterium helveticum TaxID=2592811 RepID=A0A557XJ09_9MYCO|nr:acyltransferase [Mycobacterium helveticum]TVS83561.1 acyltransferase [Mycobacterium helveticum]TVS85698.1 acyltransferase [Mycobacterium helveticum]